MPSSVLRDRDETRTQQIEPRATVHLAFDQLQLGDLAFGLAVGPCFGQCRANGGEVAADALTERRGQAAACFNKPRGQGSDMQAPGRRSRLPPP